jgi:hypothetical protein
MGMYRDRMGATMGYGLRAEMEDGKIKSAVMYCRECRRDLIGMDWGILVQEQTATLVAAQFMAARREHTCPAGAGE